MMKDIYDSILRVAWAAREHAYPHKSGTKVGCAILSDKNNPYCGWNIEGLWMTSIHAEVNAISKMDVRSGEKIKIIAVVAETESFTPCGACMDWIMQFSNDKTIVITQNKHKEVKKYTLNKLVPNYPIQ
jgi:cytidine deaminase